MIRTQQQIDTVINRSQHALADIGNQIAELLKAGVEDTDSEVTDLVYRLEISRAALQVLLTPEGDVKAYFTAPSNEKKFNAILGVLQRLSGYFDGLAIPLLGRRNIPLALYPSSSGGGGGGGTVSPGGTTFQNLSVDAPGEVIGIFDANASSFAFYIYSVKGQNPGEGLRTGIFTVS